MPAPAGVHSSSFQPMCGTLSPVCRRSTVPAKTPSPGHRPPSALLSNSSWRPRHTPFLGVCLGLQLLFESSAEGGRWPGLGVFAGTVERLQTGLKVPHIGWNELEWAPAGAGSPRAMPAPAAVYFVHSYAALPADPSIVAASTDYGGQVVAAVARDSVWAMQFHPEKSS